MPVAHAPIKVEKSTDDLVSHASHFLDRPKKAIVDAAVREYIHNHRDEINAGVAAALSQLDGSTASLVSLVSGLTTDEIDEVGGVPE